MGDRAERRRLIEQGYAFAAEAHSWESFAETVRRTFSPAALGVQP
jgi:hypothetical protein